MSSETVIRKAARDFADQAISQQPRLRAEKFDLETKLHEVKEKLRLADTAINRANTFQVHVNGRLQCPNCWVKNEVATDLATAPGNDREDIFRCPVCRYEYAVPL